MGPDHHWPEVQMNIYFFGEDTDQQAAIFATHKHRAQTLYDRLLARSEMAGQRRRCWVIRWWDQTGLERHLRAALAQNHEGWGSYDHRTGWTISRRWVK